ncbi:MAG: transcriptional regulator, family [Pelosinus sp.]|jgi:transcriptional regulator with XRE-family HTH domain|nr:transcriptional regulator, family [Pelosinus sp.]
MAKFHKRLKELREGKGESQKDLASYLKVTERALQYYETGDREPTIKNIERLATHFGVTTDYILGRTNDPDGNFADHLRSLATNAIYELISDFITLIVDEAKKATKNGKTDVRVEDTIYGIKNDVQTELALREELERMQLTVRNIILISDPGDPMGIRTVTVEVSWADNDNSSKVLK